MYEVYIALLEGYPPHHYPPGGMCTLHGDSSLGWGYHETLIPKPETQSRAKGAGCVRFGLSLGLPLRDGVRVVGQP